MLDLYLLISLLRLIIRDSIRNYRCYPFFVLFLSLDDNCQKWVVTLHRERDTKLNTIRAMGLNYIINCNHCGSRTEYYTKLACKVDAMSDANLYSHIDMQCAIRCPICRSRLNSSESAFRSQVEIVKMA